MAALKSLRKIKTFLSKSDQNQTLWFSVSSEP